MGETRRAIMFGEERAAHRPALAQLPPAVLSHSELSFGAKVLFAALYAHAWPEDHCWPSQDELARDVSCTVRSRSGPRREPRGLCGLGLPSGTGALLVALLLAGTTELLLCAAAAVSGGPAARRPRRRPRRRRGLACSPSDTQAIVAATKIRSRRTHRS